jgi:hypothetical protein
MRYLITAVLLLFASPAVADATIYCTGTLINVWLNKKAKWPMAIIVDEETKNVCVIDLGKAGHDLSAMQCRSEVLGAWSVAQAQSGLCAGRIQFVRCRPIDGS